MKKPICWFSIFDLIENLKFGLLQFYKGSIQLKDMPLLGYYDATNLLDLYIRTREREYIDAQKLNQHK